MLKSKSRGFNVKPTDAQDGRLPTTPKPIISALSAGREVAVEQINPEALEELRNLRLSTNFYSVLNNPTDGKKDKWIKGWEADQTTQTSLIERVATHPAGVAHVEYRDVSSFFEKYEKRFGTFHALLPDHQTLDKEKKPSTSAFPFNEDVGSGQNKTEAMLEELTLSPEEQEKLDQKMATCFAAVPTIFFDRNFDLRDPATFEISLLAPGGQQENQDKLSFYLDQVEVALYSQVQARSAHFFRGLADLQTLQSDVASACGTVLELRRKMQNMQSQVVEKAIKVPVLVQQQTNMTKLQEQLDLVQKLLSVRGAVPALLTGEDYLGALEVTQSAKNLLQFQLKDIIALRTSINQLEEYEKLIGDCLGNQFISFAMNIEEEPAFSLLREQDSTMEDGDAEEDEESSSKQKTISHVISGLLKLGRMQEVLELYRKRLGNDLKVVIKTVVKNYLPIAEQSEDEDGMQGLRNMDPGSFLMCIQACFDQIKSIVVKAAKVDQFLQDIFGKKETMNGAEEEKTPSSTHLDDSTDSTVNALHMPEATENDKTEGAFMSQLQNDDKEVMTTLSSQCLHNIGESIQKTISQLLQTRQEVHKKIKLEELRALWDLTIDFLKTCENITGTKGYTLKSTLLAQATAFAECSHESFMGRLTTSLDAEKWVQTEVSTERQDSLDRLASGRAFLPSTQPKHSSGTSMGSSAIVSQNPPPSPLPNGDANPVSPSVKKEAVLDGVPYKVVWSCLLLVEMIVSFLEFSSFFPTLASNVIKHISDLFKLFNTLSTDLVLEAGAIKAAAKLKNISAKHLGYLSQSLGLIRAVIPHVRAALAACLPPKQQELQLVEIDKAAQDFREHDEKILAKFVSIMEGMLEETSSSLEKFNWDAMNSDPCEFLLSVAKHTASMHKILQPLLHPSQLQDVFSRICEVFNRRLPEYFINIRPTSQAGKQRIIDEVSHIEISLRKLAGINSENLTLVKTFKDKYGRG